MIDDGAVDVRDTTATLISLSVRGVISLRQGKATQTDWGDVDAPVYAKLMRTDASLAPYEDQLLRDVFPAMEVGKEKLLSQAGGLYDAHIAMQMNVTNEISKAGWYMRPPGTSVTPADDGASVAILRVMRVFAVLVAVGVIVFFIFMAGTIGGFTAPRIGWLTFFGPLFAIVIGFLVYKGLTNRGQRSALGRAYADQVTGFREYLATAEADQLKFEEGQDIFSQYLPWAVIFDLTYRWTQICTELVQMGRLATIQPTWYYGDISTFNVSRFAQSLTSVNRAILQSPSSFGNGANDGRGSGSGSGFGSRSSSSRDYSFGSGLGFGSGSAFGGGSRGGSSLGGGFGGFGGGGFGGGGGHSGGGGGGFSGGGGGGGGARSW